MKRWILVIGTLLLAATFLLPTIKGTAARSVSPAAYQPPKHKGGTITYSSFLFPDSTNPWFALSVVDGELIPALWGLPVTVNPQGQFIPDQLTEVPTQANGDVSKDGLTVTMKLRSNLKWSDGQPLTADDFVYWLSVVQDPATGANSFGYDQIVSITAKNAQTVVLKYSHIFAPYLSYLPLAAPKHAWSTLAHQDLRGNQDVNLTPRVVSGPFELINYVSGQSFLMVPNPFYSSTTFLQSVLDQLIFTTYADQSALIAAYQAGQTLHAEDFTLPNLPQLSGLPGFHEAPAIAFEHLDFNLQNPAVQDMHVRQAIEQAIDRCQIIQTALAQPCSSLLENTVLPPPSPATDPTVTPPAFDLNAAKLNMQVAGWDCFNFNPCMQSGQPFPTLNLVTTANNALRANVTQMIQQALASLGIPVTVNFYTATVLFSDFTSGGILSTGQYDLALFAYLFAVDPDPALYPVFHSSQIPSAQNPGGSNFGRVNDAQLDSLLDQGRSTLVWSQRVSLYQQAQQRINAQVYMLPLFERPNLTLTRAKIVNYQDNYLAFSPFGGNQWNISDWWLNP